MSKKSVGFKMRLGFNDIESLMDLCSYTSEKIKKSLKYKQITTEYKFTGVEIIPDNAFGYEIIFNFDNELSIDEILDKAITGELC